MHRLELARAQSVAGAAQVDLDAEITTLEKARSEVIHFQYVADHIAELMNPSKGAFITHEMARQSLRTQRNT